MLRRHTRPGLLHRGSRGPKTPSTYGNETWTARAWEKVNTKKKNANVMQTRCLLTSQSPTRFHLYQLRGPIFFPVSPLASLI